MAHSFPVVYLTGPRQSGKTTIVKDSFPEHLYVSLEDPDERVFATEDPRGFLARLANGAVIDEIQRVPDLLSYMQTDVDRDSRPGRFVLTGSQQLLLRHQVGQTLAGRAALLHLLPFSVSELFRGPALNPHAFGRPEKSLAPPSKSLENILFEGLYPRIHDKSLDARDWLAYYYQTYVEKDVRQLLRIGDLASFQRFVRLCAGRSGQLINFSSLAADGGISHSTAREWLSVLEASFIVTRLQPHHQNFSKRLIKSPKLYFLDTGLLCYLLRIYDFKSLMTHPSRGAIFETFVISELFKAFCHRGEEPPLYFWRDRTGHEVDVIIENGAGILPVEIKSGRTLAADSFDGLRFWLSLKDNPQKTGVLVYAGDDHYKRGDLLVRPWFGCS